MGRRAFAARRAVLCRESADAVATLSSLDPEVLRYLSTGMHGAVHDLRSKLAAEYPTELSKVVWSPMDLQFLSDLLLVESEPLG